MDKVEALASPFVQAVKDHTLFPRLSDEEQPVADSTAYQVQKQVVQTLLEQDEVQGFKAALTSSKSQQKFGAEGPLTAVLLSSGLRDDAPVVRMSDYNMLLVETEVGFIVGTTIDSPLASVADLYKKVEAIVPVVELPDLRFAEGEPVQAVDLIAANAGSAQYVLGQQVSLDDLHPNDIEVTLYHEAEVISYGMSPSVLEGQWQAALWLANQVVSQGWTIEPGHVLLTGTLGGLTVGKPGNYRADFGDLGALSFVVER